MVEPVDAGQQSKPQVIKGEDAEVTIFPDKVSLVSSGVLKDHALRRKMDNLKLFNNLTKDVPGLYHPRILKEDRERARYEVERATGTNLAGNRGDSIGFGFVEFMKIPVEIKAQAALTYLRMVAAVNRGGYSFVDHQTDSVFIDPIKGKTMVVDAGSLKKEDNPELAWQHDVRGGLKDVLRAFFTKHIVTKYDENLVPASIGIVIDELEEMKTAEEAVTKLKAWFLGENYTFPVKAKGGLKRHLSIIATDFGLKEWEEKINTADFDKMTAFRIDTMEATLYREGVLKSGVPARLDKRLLKIAD